MTPAKAKTWIPIIGLLISTVAGSFYAAQHQGSGPENHEEPLREHNGDPLAHPPLRDELRECMALGNRLEALRDDQQAVAARLVRLVASDLERDSRKRALAANEAEEEFRRLLRSGASLEDAMIGALRYRR